jgi:hypothetical protein
VKTEIDNTKLTNEGERGYINDPNAYFVYKNHLGIAFYTFFKKIVIRFQQLGKIKKCNFRIM